MILGIKKPALTVGLVCGNFSPKKDASFNTEGTMLLEVLCDVSFKAELVAAVVYSPLGDVAVCQLRFLMPFYQRKVLLLHSKMCYIMSRASRSLSKIPFYRARRCVDSSFVLFSLPKGIAIPSKMCYISLVKRSWSLLFILLVEMWRRVNSAFLCSQKVLQFPKYCGI